VAFGVGPALLVWSAALRVLARADVGVHLHDTYFVVGAFHLEAAVIVSTLLAGVVAWSRPLLGRGAHARTVQFAAGLVGGGMFVHAVALLVMGQRGMPRRYVEYPALFSDGQRVATVAGAVAVLGASLLAVAWIRGERRVS
jgi:cytochrome c oxidase subunit 1